MGARSDITHAKTAPKKAANKIRAFLLSVLNGLLLDPVIFFQSNGVFQFHSNFREDGLVHSRAAGFFASYKQVFPAKETQKSTRDLPDATSLFKARQRLPSRCPAGE